MFSKRIDLFTLFGFPIRLDLSWLVIAVLVTWTLAGGLFPARYEGLEEATYWVMGAAGALGLFLSILLHELGHMLVAREFGIPIRGITLFIFGGVAEMDDEPPSARAEFYVAVAGPAVSVGIAGVLFGVLSTGGEGALPTAARGVVQYLAMINGLVVGFNLVPAFPLDGGRVLRSALWHWKGSLRWATRITSQIGSGFGLVMIGLGLFSLLSGNVVGGIWWALIGMFLRNAAQMAYQQLLLRRALEGEPVRKFMKTDPVTVPADATLEDLVENYVYRHHFKLYPVVRNGDLVGCITTRQVREVPKDEWAARTAGDLAVSCSDNNSIGPDRDAMDALSTMNRADVSRLLVVENGDLEGVLALKDLMRFLSLKVELEEAA